MHQEERWVRCDVQVVSDRSRSEEHADAGASGRKDMQFKLEHV